MSQKLPVGGFKWVYGLTVDDIRNYNGDDEIGYFVEIDCSTPENIQDYVDDLPLFPDSLVIDQDMASCFTKSLRDKICGERYRCKQKKLAPNHFPKKAYKCHILAAQMYLSLGELLKYFIPCESYAVN
jgi:hypothetical protein